MLESDSDSDSVASEEEFLVNQRPDYIELPPEYWQIQKLVKFIKVGTQTVTIIALCSIRDMNLSLETSQMAVEDAGGVELLVNLINTEDNRCRIASLSILKEITVNFKLQRSVTNLGGIKCLVELLYSPNEHLRTLAADTIANVCAYSHARTLVRRYKGLHKLITQLEIDDSLLNKNLTNDQDLSIEIVRSGASALWACSRSVRNRMVIFRSGAIHLLSKLLKSIHQKMVIPVVGTIQECASDEEFREAILKVGMIPDIVHHLKSENPELQKLSASAIFKCAVNEETRTLVYQNAGLKPLVTLLNDPATNENKDLLAAVVGAIWKCSISLENVIQFEEMKAIERLVELLGNQPQEVVINIVGALAELNKDPPNREIMRKINGIPPLIELLKVTNPSLLINVSKAIGECAKDKENMSIIDRLDGVRLIWSLLKHQKPSVQAAAAWAICPCVENAKESGEMVRSFVGGLELIISLLKSDDKEVLASICAAVAKIAMDEENLAVISDHGVVPMLAKLADTTDDKLRQNLAEAIACCSKWSKNGLEFAKSNTVSFLVSYLSSKDPEVHRSTTQALFELSRHPENCITMHEKGAVKYLITLVGSEDFDVQEWAAGSLKNIRSLAMANEKAMFP